MSKSSELNTEGNDDVSLAQAERLAFPFPEEEKTEQAERVSSGYLRGFLINGAVDRTQARKL